MDDLQSGLGYPNVLHGIFQPWYFAFRRCSSDCRCLLRSNFFRSHGRRCFHDNVLGSTSHRFHSLNNGCSAFCERHLVFRRSYKPCRCRHRLSYLGSRAGGNRRRLWHRKRRIYPPGIHRASDPSHRLKAFRCRRLICHIPQRGFFQVLSFRKVRLGSSTWLLLCQYGSVHQNAFRMGINGKSLVAAKCNQCHVVLLGVLYCHGRWGRYGCENWNAC